MKKLFLTLTAVCALTFASFAQGVSFGLKAGLNLASQKFESSGISISPDSRLGYHVGGFATIMFSETFGLQPEVLLSSVGSKFDVGGDDAIFKYTYISVPVMLRYQPIEILNIHAGPQFGILASAKGESGGDSEDLEDTKGLEIAAGFGAGIDLPMGLGFTARYVLGLTNVVDDSSEFWEDVTVKNNVFQLSVTYRFGAGD
jgi:hypothetical protein